MNNVTLESEVQPENIPAKQSAANDWTQSRGAVSSAVQYWNMLLKQPVANDENSGNSGKLVSDLQPVNI